MYKCQWFVQTDITIRQTRLLKVIQLIACYFPPKRDIHLWRFQGSVCLP